MKNSDEHREMAEKYVKLCENPLRGRSQILHEYEQLINNPRVQQIAFHGKEALMVGTDNIVINHEGCDYSIGEFIIFLVRQKKGKYFEVAFRFFNTSNYFVEREIYGAPTNKCMHPHIILKDSDVLTCSNGTMCISEGQFPVHQYLRKGEMHLAVPEIINLLETYTESGAYVEIQNWPELEREHA